MPTVTIRLGDHVFPVVAQRHARLRNALTGADLERLFCADYGEHAYRLLCVLIPAVEQGMPAWEFDGYGSAAAAKEGRYVEADDKSPTTAEIIDAFETALVKVSGVGKLGSLLGLVRDVQGMAPARPTVDGQVPAQAT